MNKKKETNQEREGKEYGITIVSLVITIIVLLILARCYDWNTVWG